jgi:SlyX protein
MSTNEAEVRLGRLEERLAWFERHVTEQDKAMMELSELVERLRREVLTLRERSAGSGLTSDSAGAAGGEERPPHY